MEDDFSNKVIEKFYQEVPCGMPWEPAAVSRRDRAPLAPDAAPQPFPAVRKSGWQLGCILELKIAAQGLSYTTEISSV